MALQQIIDQERYPLHFAGSTRGGELLDRCRSELERDGMFNLEGFVRQAAVASIAAELEPIFKTEAFTHARRHNIYFTPEIADLPADHPARREVETVNHTLCGDQISGSVLCTIYEWKPLIDFIAAVLGKPQLHAMGDPLARVNVMAYGNGEALNWHFDRSEFTVTLLLQAPERGGQFQYRSGLRSDDDANYEGVAALLDGHDNEVKTLALSPGTLNVFKGRNTAHRVTPVEGVTQRMLAVLSYFDRPGVMFSHAERIGFYGRAA